MATAKRGGARPGAGRKPILSDLQRLKVGAAIERRLWRRTRAEFARTIDVKLAEDEVPQNWERLRAVPVADRRRVDKAALDMLLEDIAVDIEEGVLQGRRYLPGPTRVKPGIRDPIIRSVARAASRMWRVPVSARAAEICLEEYRAMSARADVQLACDGVVALLRWLGAMPPDV
jgi:hypothetical protein